MLLGLLGCETAIDLPNEPDNTPLIQSVELHYPFDQVNTDSFFYDQGALVRMTRESTGFIDQLVYSFQNDGTSKLVFFENS